MATEEKNELITLNSHQAEIAKAINIDSDLDQVGADIQHDISSNADAILNNAKVRDTGPVVSQQLSELATKVKNQKFDNNHHSFLAQIFHRTKNTLTTQAEKQRQVQSLITNISSELDSKRDTLNTSNEQLKTTQNSDLKAVKNLTDNIEALKFKLQQLQQDLKHDDQLVKEHPEKQTDIDFQHNYARKKDYANRLKNRITDLQVTRDITAQQITKIDILIAGNNTMYDQLGSAKHNLIPILKDQGVTAVATINQQEAIEMSRTLRETTSNMLTSSTKQLAQNVNNIINEKQTPLVDVKSLKQVHDDIINIMTHLTDESNKTANHQSETIEELDKLNDESTRKIAPHDEHDDLLHLTNNEGKQNA